MTPKSLMIIGGFGGGFLAVLAAFWPDPYMATALFGLGALFGKGYGIWEERQRPVDNGDGR